MDLDGSVLSLKKKEFPAAFDELAGLLIWYFN